VGEGLEVGVRVGVGVGEGVGVEKGEVLRHEYLSLSLLWMSESGRVPKPFDKSIPLAAR
jgi:hypothetical protein